MFVQTFAVGQHAIVEDGGDDAFALHRRHLQLHDAIVQQQHIACDNIARQFQITDAHLGGIARRHTQPRHQVETVAGLELHFAVGKRLHPDFGAGQVGQNAHFAAKLGRHRPHRFTTRHLRRRVAVGKIQPHHIHPGTQHCFQHLGRVGSRAKGGDDAGVAALLWLCGGHKWRNDIVV